MTVTRVGVPEFVREVHDAVVGLGEGDTTVLDACVENYVDAVTEMEAWRVTLYLSRPRGLTWNVRRLLALAWEAEERTDEIAFRRRLELEGHTMVQWASHDPRPPVAIPYSVLESDESTCAAEDDPGRE